MSAVSSALRPLRVVSVTRVLPTPNDPSQGIFVLNRLKAMSRLTDLTIVQPVPHFPILKSRPHWADEKDGALTRVPMFYIPRILKSLDSGWFVRAVEPTLADLNGSRRIDAIDAHFGYPDGVACVGIGARLNVPVFVTLRGVENEQLQTRGIGKQMRIALDRAEGCICVSHFLAELAVRNGVAEHKIKVIHNSVDRSLFHTGPSGRSRAELELPTDRPVVVSIGHLVPRKRHHLLVEAFADSSVRRQGAYLVILGSPTHDPKYAALLRDLIRERGLEHTVRLVGNRPPAEIGDYLRAGDLFALLSAREGCCNAVLEALACGLPVLTTDVGDNRYFVNESNGCIVGVDNADQAVEGLLRVLSRTDWNRQSLSATLPIGDWNDVARRVVSFIGNH